MNHFHIRFALHHKELGFINKIAPTAHLVAKTGFLFSLLLLIPTIVSLMYMDHVFPAFAFTAGISIGACAITWLLTMRYNRELRPRDGYKLVFMLWIGLEMIVCL